MVEQDSWTQANVSTSSRLASGFYFSLLTITSVHPISLSIVDYDPVTVQLGDTVRRSRVERGGLLLRSFDDFAVQLGRRGLVEPGVLLESTRTDGIE